MPWSLIGNQLVNPEIPTEGILGEGQRTDCKNGNGTCPHRPSAPRRIQAPDHPLSHPNKMHQPPRATRRNIRQPLCSRYRRRTDPDILALISHMPFVLPSERSSRHTSCRRQSKAELTAFSGGGFHPDSPAVAFDNLFADRQADAGILLTRRISKSSTLCLSASSCSAGFLAAILAPSRSDHEVKLDRDRSSSGRVPNRPKRCS